MDFADMKADMSDAQVEFWKSHWPKAVAAGVLYCYAVAFLSLGGYDPVLASAIAREVSTTHIGWIMAISLTPGIALGWVATMWWRQANKALSPMAFFWTVLVALLLLMLPPVMALVLAILVILGMIRIGIRAQPVTAATGGRWHFAFFLGLVLALPLVTFASSYPREKISIDGADPVLALVLDDGDGLVYLTKPGGTIQRVPSGVAVTRELCRLGTAPLAAQAREWAGQDGLDSCSLSAVEAD